MKVIYRKHLQAALDRELPGRFPEYVTWRIRLSKDQRRVSTLFPGSRLFGRRTPEGAAFIHLIPHQRQEELLAEVGWSVDGEFPAHFSSHGPPVEPQDELEEAAWLVDFGTLYHRKYHRAHLGWPVWECSVPFDHPEFGRLFVAEDLAPVSEVQAQERVNVAVDVCLRDLEDVAGPYLDQWLSRRVAS